MNYAKMDCVTFMRCSPFNLIIDPESSDFSNGGRGHLHVEEDPVLILHGGCGPTPFESAAQNTDVYPWPKPLHFGASLADKMFVISCVGASKQEEDFKQREAKRHNREYRARLKEEQQQKEREQKQEQRKRDDLANIRSSSLPNAYEVAGVFSVDNLESFISGCCSCEVLPSDKRCPNCGRLIIGWYGGSDEERNLIRKQFAGRL